MAGMRERGTDFLTESSGFSVKGRAIGFANHGIFGAAFSTIASTLVDADCKTTGHVFERLDFSDLFVVSSNPTIAAVPSLTVAPGAGLATPVTV